MAEKFTPSNVLLKEKMSGSVPAEYRDSMVKDVIQNSVVMQLGQFEEMTDKNGEPVQEKKFTFMADGIGAYWVGEAEKIQTTKPTWLDATIKTHKLGVIIPVSREFLSYELPDFFEKMKDKITKAFYKKFDEAVILNINNPFAQSIDGSVVSAGKTIEGNIDYDNILALEDSLFDDDIEGNAFISKVQNNTVLRSVSKTVNGIPQELYDKGNGRLDGLPVVNLSSSSMAKGTVYLGDFDHMYYGIPYTMNYAISDAGTLSTITNIDGTDVNLFEQELLALRATMDVAFMITKDNAFAKIIKEPHSDLEASVVWSGGTAPRPTIYLQLKQDGVGVAIKKVETGITAVTFEAQPDETSAGVAHVYTVAVTNKLGVATTPTGYEAPVIDGLKATITKSA